MPSSYGALREYMFRATATELDNTREYMFQANAVELNSYHMNRADELAATFNYEVGGEHTNEHNKSCYTCGKKGHLPAQCPDRHIESR